MSLQAEIEKLDQKEAEDLKSIARMKSATGPRILECLEAMEGIIDPLLFQQEHAEEIERWRKEVDRLKGGEPLIRLDTDPAGQEPSSDPENVRLRKRISELCVTIDVKTDEIENIGADAIWKGEKLKEAEKEIERLRGDLKKARAQRDAAEKQIKKMHRDADRDA